MHHLIRGAIILASCACVAESFATFGIPMANGNKRCTSKPSNWSDQWGTCGTYKTKNWCTKAGKVQYSRAIVPNRMITNSYYTCFAMFVCIRVTIASLPLMTY